MAEERGSYTYMVKWLNTLGYSPDTRMAGKIASYWGWYTAQNKWYSYKERRGLRSFQMNRETLHPAAMVAEAWSDLLMNEKLAITSEDEGMAQVIADHFAGFGVAHADFVTRAFALGTGGWAINVKDVSDDGMLHPDALIEIEEYDATQVLPITWGADDCTQCAFATRVEHGGRDYEQCQAHIIKDGTYHIITQLFDVKNHEQVNLEDITADLDTGSPFPTFALVKPAVPNPHFDYCAMGASVYDKGISAIKMVDEALTSMLVHIRVAKPRVFVDETVIEKKKVRQSDGTYKERFYAFGEADDMYFRMKPGGENDKPMNVIQPEMREAENEAAINLGLKTLSLTCGLGDHYWDWDKASGLKTATEVVSDSSMLARTLRKHQNALGKSITALVRGIAGVCRHLCGTDVNPAAPIAIDFDDSVITDTQSDKQQALSEISILGIPELTKKYLVKYCDFTEDEAAAAVPASMVVDEGF